LAFLGRLAAIVEFPREFDGLIDRSGSLAQALGDSDAAVGFLIGMLIAFIGGAALAAFFWQRLSIDLTKLTGNVSALIPQTVAERFWALLLSINAGVGEELLFRLLLPLLLAMIGLPLWAAFAFAAAVFGVVHCYQGWRGVAATTLFGAAMTLLYLRTGELWLAMLVHALVDINGLIIRPLIASMIGRRSKPSA